MASDSCFTGEAMAVGHLSRPVRSATYLHVGLSDVLLLGPLQTLLLLRGMVVGCRTSSLAAGEQNDRDLLTRMCVVFFLSSKGVFVRCTMQTMK